MGWLTGWKEIGEYTGLSEKTIHKYFKFHALPVHRLPGTNKPIAIREEVDNWIKNMKKIKNG